MACATDRGTEFPLSPISRESKMGDSRSGLGRGWIEASVGT